MPQTKIMQRKPKKGRKGAYPGKKAGRGRRGRGAKKDEGKAGRAAVRTRRGRGRTRRKGGKKEKRGWQQGFIKKPSSHWADTRGVQECQGARRAPLHLASSCGEGNIEGGGKKRKGQE